MPKTAPAYEVIETAIRAAIESQIGPDNFTDPETGEEFSRNWGDYKFWRPEEWKNDIGRKSLLTLSFEGVIYDYINYGVSDGEAEMRAMGLQPRRIHLGDAIQDALDPLGLYYELGYAWSLHVYPV